VQARLHGGPGQNGSTRGYVEQIDRFNTYSGKPTSRADRVDKGVNRKRVLTPRQP
jgi:hypothetical protein